MLASINLGVYIRFVGAIMRRFTHVNIVNYNYIREQYLLPLHCFPVVLLLAVLTCKFISHVQNKVGPISTAI